VEIWPESRVVSRPVFDDWFGRYIYGPTPAGEYGLPYQLKALDRHGLKGVFFVEVLFSLLYGEDYLRRIVDLIQEAGHDVQLHLHTEWIRSLPEPLLQGRTGSNLAGYSIDDQRRLFEVGVGLLKQAGAANVNAFRAGNYAINSDSWAAMAPAGIAFDSSYNPCHIFAGSSFEDSPLMMQPAQRDGVCVYPVSVFEDRPGHLRHLQIGACSSAELIGVLDAAYALQWPAVVAVSHSFELMSANRRFPDRIAARRFDALCGHLAKYPERFDVCVFDGHEPVGDCAPVAPIRSPWLRTATRMGEQAARRIIDRLRTLSGGYN
jgi:hypothetical protein